MVAFTSFTCKELLVLNDRDVPVEAWDIEKLRPRDADLENVRALPVIKSSPGRQNQHPVFTFQQGLYERSNANVDVSAKVEPFRRVYIIQKVSGENKATSLLTLNLLHAFFFTLQSPDATLSGWKGFLFHAFVVLGR